MRIHRVTARAFGPFRGDELHLSPGMNVVSGPNESGKSSWHAALRLALTGLRRGKGPGTLAERQMAERHRPWDGSERWEVEARLELADGRQIEMHQDLAGKVDCRAVDVGLGRDVSHEILDGTPDASRWLGLNRETFAATVSVSQAQIMAVTEAADELQEQLQRAAAAHGTDATAAEAIARLEQFRRDAVGIDRIGARGPLRTAKDRLAAAEARVADAQRQHEEYLDRSVAAEAVERRLAAARREVLRAEAQLAAARATAAHERNAAVVALAARHPRRPEPLAARDERADAVAAALDAWVSRPQPVPLDGPPADELERELATLPDVPTGDREPHPTTRAALRALDLAEGALAAVDDEPRATSEQLPPVEEEVVRSLARRLTHPRLPGAEAVEHEVASARAAAASGRASRWLPVGAAAAALATGAILAALGFLPAAIAVVVLGLLIAGGAWWVGAGRRAAARLARAQAALAPYRAAWEAAEHDRQAAESEAIAAGLPADVEELEQLADRLADADAERRLAAARAERRAAIVASRDAARTDLAGALAERGETPGGDVRAAWTAYERRCRQRAEQAAAAARRAPLERQIEARRAAEASAAASVAARRASEARLRSAAAAVGVDAAQAPERVVSGLRRWQQDRADRLRENETAIAEWQRLQALLDGRSRDELGADADAAQRRAEQLAAELGETVDAPRDPIGALEARLADLRRALAEVGSESDSLHGSLAVRRERLPDVAEAEEEVLAARAELQRVLTLGATLDRTLVLLRDAEERVHRSLAPVLAGVIARWLPVVSHGAYAEASVDPADLSVRVKEAATGKWREARLLSEGTREQIYLLLRVAMAEHLIDPRESAPLLLDEVTAQSDSGRKRQLLSVLHRLSAERQVVLFTHDDDVLEWADRHLDAGRDAVIRLPARPAPLPASAAQHTPSAHETPIPVGD